MKLDSHYFSSIISRNGSKELLENFTDTNWRTIKVKKF